MKQVLEHFRVDQSLPDRVTVWIDVLGRSVNVFFEEVFDELCTIVERMDERSEASRSPLVFRSAKSKGFVVGADLRRIARIDSDRQIQQFMLTGQLALDCLQRSRSMTLAVIDGQCLGGGLEFALACHHRIASDSRVTLIGMPEVKLGLMPGWGGTHRLVKTVGPIKALKMLLTGEPIKALQARYDGLIDRVIDPKNFEQSITDYLRTGPKISGSPHSPLSNVLTMEQVEQYGPLSLAQDSIVQAVRLGMESPSAGLRAERELFFRLLSSPSVQQNLQRYL